MSRKLFKQIRNEWKSNIWLALELLVVSVVLWYILDNFYVNYKILSMPLGFDVEHCYKLTFDDVTDKSPDYIPDQSRQDRLEEKLTILDRLQHHPIVEAAALSNNSHPYNGSNSGSFVWRDTFQTTGYTIRRVVTPDFMKVFRYQGTRGETPEQLSRMLEEEKVITSNNLFKRQNARMTDFVGKELWVDDTANVKVLGASLIGPRYNDFTDFDHTIFWKAGNREILWCDEYTIRVKPEMDKNVEESLMNQAETMFHVGNKLLVNVQSFKDIRRIVQQNNWNSVWQMAVGMGFLLLNIFLGLFGTFWFRTQQRVNEIAIRKAMGATNWEICRRLLSEGLLLLLVITPFAFGIDCLLAYFEMNQYYDGGYFGWDRVAICAAGAAALVALMVIAGVWFPASRAEKVDPAIALKDE